MTTAPVPGPPATSRLTSGRYWSPETPTVSVRFTCCSAATHSKRRRAATVSFLETALAEGRRYEQQVAQDLSAVVFERAFPRLVQALAEHTQLELAELRGPALILLYRLLFVLYAEDLGLLPGQRFPI